MLKTHIFRALSAVALAASVAAVAAAPAAAHRLPSRKIVTYKSVGGVALGTKPAAVKRKLGKPTHVTRTGGKISEFQYENVGMSVQFDTLHKGDPASFVGALTGRYHTSKGIHPGSSVRALKRAYGRALKHTAGMYVLYKGKPGTIGSRRTDFTVFSGKIATIDVQVVFNDL